MMFWGKQVSVGVNRRGRFQQLSRKGIDFSSGCRKDVKTVMNL